MCRLSLSLLIVQAGFEFVEILFLRAGITDTPPQLSPPPFFFLFLVNYTPDLTGPPFFQKHEFSVDMTCEGCADAVARVLNKLGGE